MATNLETLELTISSNAESASKGLTSLINSLTTLSSKLNDAFKNAAKLNVEMEKLGRSKGVRLPSSGSGSRVRSTATKATQGAMQTYKFAPGFAPQPGSIVNIGGQSLKVATPADVANLKGFGEAANTSEKNVSFLSKALAKAKEVGQSASKGFSRVGRIFSTMLIRTAIRSFIKEMSSAWTACYNFSKQMGGSFAQSVDKAKTLLAGTAINIMRTFAPAIEALLPVLTAVASAIQYLCSAIQYLFSLLGMSSGLWGASTDSIQKYSKAASGGSKANKEMLASFDELNVISSESGGGGGGAGGAAYTGFADAISADFNAITALLVGEGLIALGLILACTGHIPIGIGLIAVGAASIAKVLVEDWNKLPQGVQSTILKIMAITGGAFLAIGAILAFTGANIPLGIGLMIVGAANLAAAAYLSWGGLSNDVKKQITDITKIVSVALIAVGAIIALSGANIPLGVCLIAAGAAGLAASVALSWNTLDKKMQSKVVLLTNIVSTAVLAVGAILAFTGANIPLGIGLMIAGAAGLAASAYLTWKLDDSVKEKVIKLTAIVGTALLAVGAILAFTGANIGLGVGLMIAGAASLASAAVLTWSLEKTVSDKIGKLVGIASGASLALGAVLAFTGANIPLGIALMAAGAIGLIAAINPNWDELYSEVSQSFGLIKDCLVRGWEEVRNKIEDVASWLEKITGTHYVEVIQKIRTEGTPESNTATVVNKVLKETTGGTLMGTIMQSALKLVGIGKAEGAYGIPRGEVFVAQEAGAELVGEINGKTSVANQGQIIEGIASGVERANSEQNTLLRQQNELLRGILEKDASVRIGASAALGRVTRQSLDMYGAMVGG